MELRVIIFFAALVFFSMLEYFFPRIKTSFNRVHRWKTNYALVVLGNLAVKYLLPLSTLYLATYCHNNNLGLFNYLGWDNHFITLLSVIILDGLIYTQHLVFHLVPVLWKLHQVHHMDRCIDVSSALRFHPLEIYISVLIKMIFVALLGLSFESILIFEIVLNFCAMFNHGNIYLPEKLDAFLSKFIVTPDFHRIHHSVIKDHTNSNYGFNLSLWDHLFKTQTHLRFDQQETQVIGITEENLKGEQGLLNLLKRPFS